MSTSRKVSRPVSNKHNPAALVLVPERTPPAVPAATPEASSTDAQQTAVSPARAFMVRLAAEVVADVRAVVYRENAPSGMQKGLLLGTATEKLANIEALHPVSAGEDIQHAIRSWKSPLHANPEGLDLVGWYAVRSADDCELTPGDIAFHRHQFPNASDVAVLFGAGHSREVLTTVYTGSPKDDAFTLENRRSGTLRLHERNPETSALISVLSGTAASDFYLLVPGSSSGKTSHGSQQTGFFASLLPLAKRRLWLTLAGIVLLSGTAATILLTRSHTPVPEDSTMLAADVVPDQSESVTTSPDRSSDSGQLAATKDLNPAPPASRLADRPTADRKTDRKENRKQEATKQAFDNARTLRASAIRNVHVPLPAVQAGRAGIPAPAPEIAQIPSPALAADTLPLSLTNPLPPAPAAVHARFGPVTTTASAGEPASGLIPPQPVKSAVPRVSSAVLATLNAPLTIEVQVEIDKSGRVTQARAFYPANASTVLVEAARAAAREWVFQPATLGGAKVSGRHTMSFQFRPLPAEHKFPR